MSPKEITTLVAKAITLDRLLSNTKEKLDDLKAQLIEVAEAVPEDLRTATDGGGWSINFESDAGIARVTQPGDKIKSSVDPETKPGALVLSTLGKLKDQFLTPALSYTPVENFRERAVELFSPAVARKLIKMVTSESKPKVAFETKD